MKTPILSLQNGPKHLHLLVYKAVVIAENLDLDYSYDFENGFAVVIKNTDDGDIYGFMNEKGELMGDGYVYSFAGSFDKNGYAKVTLMDGTETYINTEFQPIKPKKSEIEQEFENNYGFNMYVTKDEEGNLLTGLMDENDNKTTEAIYSYDPQLVIRNDFIFLHNATGTGGSFINNKGEEVITINGIKDAAVFNNTIRCVKYDGNYYLYDLEGNQLTTRGFDDLYCVNDDYAVVLEDYKFTYIIDKYGNVIYDMDNMLMYYYDSCIVDSGYFFVEDDGVVKLIKLVRI